MHLCGAFCAPGDGSVLSRERRRSSEFIDQIESTEACRFALCPTPRPEPSSLDCRCACGRQHHRQRPPRPCSSCRRSQHAAAKVTRLKVPPPLLLPLPVSLLYTPSLPRSASSRTCLGSFHERGQTRTRRVRKRGCKEKGSTRCRIRCCSVASRSRRHMPRRAMSIGRRPSLVFMCMPTGALRIRIYAPAAHG